MNRISYVLVVLFGSLLFTSGISPVNEVAALAEEPTEAQRGLIVSKLSLMPLHFTENKGQFGEKTRFRCDALGATFCFAGDEVAYLFSRETDELIEQRKGSLTEMDDRLSRPRHKREGLLVRAKFVGSDPNAEVIGEGILPHKCNYFLGNDPTKWRTNVSNYSAVRYSNIYPGIDLKYYGDGHSLKYDFIVRLGADPSAIRVEYDGVDSLWINERSELVVATRFGNIVERVPYLYQEIGGRKQEVLGHYMLIGVNQFGLAVSNEYDRSKPLVIDPELSYSTYLGGSSSDYGYGIAVDGSGNAYVTGYTLSTDFPTLNPYQTDQGIDDVLITKLSPSGSSLIYSTYLGGSAFDRCFGIAVDGSGNAYVTGLTGSSDFPTVNPYQVDQGDRDVFVTKLSPSGSSLTYSTYLGGGGTEQGNGIAVDGSGNAYVTGYTYSTDFPTLNPYQGNQAYDDVFITKLSTSGNSLIYSTYLGGDGGDRCWGIAADGSGNAYVTGTTGSSDFPTLTPYQGDQDAFITKLSPSGSSLVYSTYLGGSDQDNGSRIGVDSSGSAYVAGYTLSTDFPIHNPYQGDQGGGDVFITKLSTSGSSLIYSTYLGGSDDDWGGRIAVDGSGSAYVAGHTPSTDFPTLNPYQAYQGADDAFITKLSPSGSALIYSTYLGGSHDEAVNGIAVDDSGNAYVTGLTFSSDFPTVNPYQGDQGGSDVFVAKLSRDAPQAFLRSDADADMDVEMSDAIYTLKYLYVPGSPIPDCMDAADSDDGGSIEMSDAVYTLRYLYVPGAPQPPAPFPDCGVDPTADELDCEEHPCMGDRSVVRKKIGR